MPRGRGRRGRDRKSKQRKRFSTRGQGGTKKAPSKAPVRVNPRGLGNRTPALPRKNPKLTGGKPARTGKSPSLIRNPEEAHQILRLPKTELDQVAAVRGVDPSLLLQEAERMLKRRT